MRLISRGGEFQTEVAAQEKKKGKKKEKRGNMFWSSDVECVALCSQKRSRVVLTESRYEEAQTYKQGMHHRKKG